MKGSKTRNARMFGSRSPALELFFVLCVVTTFLGCKTSKESSGHEIIVEFDMSANDNPKQVLRIRGNVMGLRVDAMSTRDNAIDEHFLKSLLQDVTASKPTIILVGNANRASHGVFYLAFNFESPLVKLAITSNNEVAINGEQHDSPIWLAPGAHAFCFDEETNRVEHTLANGED